MLKNKFALKETDTTVTAEDNHELEPLTFEEENAIYYVGGYVVRQLKAHEADAELIHGLDHLQAKESDDQCEAAVWTNTINRGGLIRISKEAQQTFVSIGGDIVILIKLTLWMKQLRKSLREM